MTALSRFVLLAVLTVLPGAAAAADCKTTGTFEKWLHAFKAEAQADGISQATLASAAPFLQYDRSIVARDRGQRFFSQGFLDFYGKLANKGREQRAKRQVELHRATFARSEKDYGVPAAVVTAFWALESDFGSGMGNLPVLRSLATLAYDCRRGDMFRAELKEALRIIDRGDLKAADMIGSWAGELGQTQFLPAHYNKHAVDYDGDGRRDLFTSAPDIIASTSNFIVSLGWKRAEPWIEEVRVPASLAWQEADLAIKHPRRKWAEWGVSRIDGKPLPKDALPASLVLPMGRNGPALLAYENFDVYLKWNQSLSYAITAAHLAARIDGAPQLSRGKALVPVLTFEAAKDLQRELIRLGHLQGEADGKLGAATRAAVKKAQLKLGLPADSYPTAELLARLKAGR